MLSGFSCFLSPPSPGASQHVKTCTGEQSERARRERREGGPVALSNSTGDRWEGLPGVKVQSQANMTPHALVLDCKDTFYTSFAS